MFYDNFLLLCKEKGVSRTKACVDCGLSRTAWNKWQGGAVPNGETLNRMADYFGVTAGYLLGTETEMLLCSVSSQIAETYAPSQEKLAAVAVYAVPAVLKNPQRVAPRRGKDSKDRVQLSAVQSYYTTKRHKKKTRPPAPTGGRGTGSPK